METLLNVNARSFKSLTSTCRSSKTDLWPRYPSLSYGILPTTSIQDGAQVFAPGIFSFQKRMNPPVFMNATELRQVDLYCYAL
jgi:hypothetical protein